MVRKIITNLDSPKAFGPGCIPVMVPKIFDPKISYILAEFFNIYLKEPCFRNFWKTSLMVPVFKNVGKGLQLKTTALLVFFLIGLLINWKNVAFFLICSMVLGLCNQLQIF